MSILYKFDSILAIQCLERNNVMMGINHPIIYKITECFKSKLSREGMQEELERIFSEAHKDGFDVKPTGLADLCYAIIDDDCYYYPIVIRKSPDSPFISQVGEAENNIVKTDRFNHELKLYVDLFKSTRKLTRMQSSRLDSAYLEVVTELDKHLYSLDMIEECAKGIKRLNAEIVNNPKMYLLIFKYGIYHRCIDILQSWTPHGLVPKNISEHLHSDMGGHTQTNLESMDLNKSKLADIGSEITEYFDKNEYSESYKKHISEELEQISKEISVKYKMDGMDLFND